MLSPITFAGDALELLDQTALPAEERWIRCVDADEVAAAIRRLAVRGAPAIGIAAAYGLALAARAAGDRDEFEAACARLAAARPTAVNLRWAVERARSAFNAGGGGDAVLAAARAIDREQHVADERLATHALDLFAPGDRVLTHCNSGALATGASGTAGGAVVAAWRAGRVREVWVDETRPLLQGARLTAWELSRAGVPHRVVTDSSAAALMARGLVDRVIVGADRIAANGDVANKIGTYALAVLAAHHGVPFLVAAPSSTLDPASARGADIPIEERDPAEVTTFAGQPTCPPGTAAANFAFDVTPAALVTAIVTEAGVLRAPYEPAIRQLVGPATEHERRPLSAAAAAYPRAAT